MMTLLHVLMLGVWWISGIGLYIVGSYKDMSRVDADLSIGYDQDVIQNET
jgi:hypothetical protein